jgi:hypothetical protein
MSWMMDAGPTLSPAKEGTSGWLALPSPAFVPSVIANNTTTTGVAATSRPSVKTQTALPCERDRFTALSAFTRPCAATPTNR